MTLDMYSNGVIARASALGVSCFINNRKSLNNSSVIPLLSVYNIEHLMADGIGLLAKQYKKWNTKIEQFRVARNINTNPQSIWFWHMWNAGQTRGGGRGGIYPGPGRRKQFFFVISLNLWSRHISGMFLKISEIKEHSWGPVPEIVDHFLNIFFKISKSEHIYLWAPQVPNFSLRPWWNVLLC